MRIESQVTVCALNDSPGAGFTGRQPAVDVPSAIPSGNGVREDAHYLTEQFPVEGEREAQRKRHRNLGLPALALPRGFAAPFANCHKGTSGKMCSVRLKALSLMRLPRQLGHTARAWHESGTT